MRLTFRGAGQAADGAGGDRGDAADGATAR